MKKKKITIIGGGTGLSSVLKGLRDLDYNVSAVVSVADNGGSSGFLRKDLDLIPPGDLRNCLLALSTEDDQVRELFNYRFKKGAFEGHNIGNLILVALEDLYGGMEKAVYEFGNIFKVRGHVYPASLEKIDIIGRLKNGIEVLGENELPLKAIEYNTSIENINLYPTRPRAFKNALRAIKEADIILIGPGSLYTSILPVLLVSGIKETIIANKCKKVYMMNLMTQPGETTQMRAKDHLQAIIDHVEDNFIDTVVINDEIIDEAVVGKYGKDGASAVYMDIEDEKYFNDLNLEIIKTPLIESTDGYVRHKQKAIEHLMKELFKR